MNYYYLVKIGLKKMNVVKFLFSYDKMIGII